MGNFLHCSVQVCTGADVSNQLFFKLLFNFHSQPGFLEVTAVSESAKCLGIVCAQILLDHTASVNQCVFGSGDVFRVTASSQFFSLHFSLPLMVFLYSFLAS